MGIASVVWLLSGVVFVGALLLPAMFFLGSVPTRLEIVVVDSACKPIPDAIVELWHCSPLGIYSAAKTAEAASAIGYDSSNFSDLNEQFCTGGDKDGEENDWFRAHQKAGADGRVTFDTVFPGWYKGRTIHVHFMVTVGSQTYVTSQFFFDDTLNNEILADHATYSVNGAKNTTNVGDMVASVADAQRRCHVHGEAERRRPPRLEGHHHLRLTEGSRGSSCPRNRPPRARRRPRAFPAARTASASKIVSARFQGRRTMSVPSSEAESHRRAPVQLSVCVSRFTCAQSGAYVIPYVACADFAH